MLEVLELAGGGDRPGVEHRLVTRDPLADLGDVGLGLGHLALEVGDGRAHGDLMVAQLAGASVESDQLGDLRDRATPMRQLAQDGVEVLQVEQSELGCGISAHRWASPRGTSTDR